MKMSHEAKTGLFVLICVAALGALIIKVGNFTLLRHGYVVKARFHYTGGVQKHAPLRLSGVDVGEVKDIRLVYGDQTMIELDLWLEDGVKLREGSVAYVTTLGMMGEKYVEIKSGTSSGNYLKEGDLLLSEDPVRLEELMKLGTKVADDIGKMAQDISKMTKHIDESVVDNRPKLDHIFDNLEETSMNFNDFSTDIKYHPWKLLMKGKEKSKEEILKDKTLHHQEKT